MKANKGTVGAWGPPRQPCLRGFGAQRVTLTEDDENAQQEKYGSQSHAHSLHSVIVWERQWGTSKWGWHLSPTPQPGFRLPSQRPRIQVCCRTCWRLLQCFSVRTEHSSPSLSPYLPYIYPPYISLIYIVSPPSPVHLGCPSGRLLLQANFSMVSPPPDTGSLLTPESDQGPPELRAPIPGLPIFVTLQVKAKVLITVPKALYDLVSVPSQASSRSTFLQSPNSGYTGLPAIPGACQAWSCLRALVLAVPSA